MASGKALEAGQTYDVSDKDGAILIGASNAVANVALGAALLVGADIVA